MLQYCTVVLLLDDSDVLITIPRRNRTRCETVTHCSFIGLQTRIPGSRGF